VIELFKKVCLKFAEPATRCNYTGYMPTVSIFELLVTWQPNCLCGRNFE